MVKRCEHGDPIPGEWMDRANATIVATSKEFAPLFVVALLMLIAASMVIITVCK